jgi:hypothetical protein
MPPLNEQQWRLGHKRRWWQWNVITLGLALFVLVWAREIFSLPLNAAVLLCLMVFFGWALLPAVMRLRYCRRCDELIPLTQLNFASGLCPTCQKAIEAAALERRVAEQNRQREIETAAATVAAASCPECQGQLLPITLLGRQGSFLSDKMGIDTKVAYYGEFDIERNLFGGHYDAKGVVHARKCEACHRIFLYGIPR